MADKQARPKDGGEILGWSRKAAMDVDFYLNEVDQDAQQGIIHASSNVIGKCAQIIAMAARPLLAENAALKEKNEGLRKENDKLRKYLRDRWPKPPPGEAQIWKEAPNG